MMNGKYFSHAILLAAAFAMAAIIGYGIVGEHKFSHNIFSILIIFVLPTVMGVGFVAAMRLSDPYRTNLALVIFTSIICINRFFIKKL